MGTKSEICHGLSGGSPLGGIPLSDVLNDLESEHGLSKTLEYFYSAKGESINSSIPGF